MMKGMAMKLLQSILFSMLLGAAVTAHAVDQEVQIDILMAKIINAQKEGRAADALPAMAKIESMESALSKPLPEGFHFLYVNTLDEAGDHANALRRANIYMEKFGKRGKNYAKVVDIMSRIEDAADKNAKAAAERKLAEENAEKERVARKRREGEGHCARASAIHYEINRLVDSYPVGHACSEYPSCDRAYDKLADEKKEEQSLCDDYRNR